MPSPSNSLSILHDACPPDEKERQIQFVHVSDHNIAKPASCTATARSHVMKRFHRRKQLDSSQRLENFRYVTGQEVFKKRKRPTTTQMKPTLLSPEATVVAPAKLDPFDCLAANASELPALLANRKSSSNSNLRTQDLTSDNTIVNDLTKTRTSIATVRLTDRIKH